MKLLSRAVMLRYASVRYNFAIIIIKIRFITVKLSKLYHLNQYFDPKVRFKSNIEKFSKLNVKTGTGDCEKVTNKQTNVWKSFTVIF